MQITITKLFSLWMLLCSTNLFSSQNNENQIIPGASYYIYEGDIGITGGIPSSSKYVTFYTFDGNEIAKKEHHFSFPGISKQLDPAALKPQPSSCQIRFWPACYLGGWYKGSPGWFIVFYDKHGNRIKSYCYDREKKEISFSLEKDDSRQDEKKDTQPNKGDMRYQISDSLEDRIYVPKQTQYERKVFQLDEASPSLIDQAFPLDLGNLKGVEFVVGDLEQEHLYQQRIMNSKKRLDSTVTCLEKTFELINKLSKPYPIVF